MKDKNINRVRRNVKVTAAMDPEIIIPI